MSEAAVATKSRQPVVVAANAQLAVEPDKLITVEMAAVVFGLTRRAIEGKIYRGQWVEGRQFHRDPTGSIWIDRKGVRQWVVGG